jgi:hypothetical protein
MPVVAADIAWYASAVFPKDDTVLNIGGAIDLTRGIVFTRLGTANALEMLSSNAGDTTQDVTIFYLDSTGALQSEVKTLNGVNVVAFVNSKLIFLAAEKSASTAGTVTIRKTGAGATIATLAAAMNAVQIPFYNQLIDPNAQTDFYDKIFVKNQHGTLAVNSAQIAIAADPQGVITFALETSLNGTGTNGAGNNRKVAPAGFTFDTSTKNVANGGVLSAGSAQGAWLRSRLATIELPFDDTFTLRLSGVSA